MLEVEGTVHAKTLMWEGTYLIINIRTGTNWGNVNKLVQKRQDHARF